MSEEAWRGIRRALTWLTELVRKGDSAGIAAFWKEDAVMLAPNMDAVQGRDAVKRLYEYLFSVGGYKDVEFTTLEVIGIGDTVAERGTYVSRSQPRGQKLTEDKGKYITIWKHTPQGWQVHWDIFNSSLPPPKTDSA